MSHVVMDGTIDADKVYTLRTFQALSGMGVASMREARRKGLRVRRCGLRSFVVGKDFHDFLMEHGAIVGLDK